MAEYIERETILDAISEQRRFYLHERDGETDMEKLYLLWGSDNALTTMEDIMSDIPAADVAPVVHETPMLRYRPERYERYDEYGINENGEMLYVKRVLVDEKSYAMYCPACGKRICSRFKSFCPNCGAKMDGGEKANE